MYGEITLIKRKIKSGTILKREVIKNSLKTSFIQDINENLATNAVNYAIDNLGAGDPGTTGKDGMSLSPNNDLRYSTELINPFLVSSIYSFLTDPFGRFVIL